MAATLLCGCKEKIGPDLSGAWKLESQVTLDGTLTGEEFYLLCNDVFVEAGQPGHYTMEATCSIGPQAFTIGEVTLGGKTVSKAKEICTEITEYGWRSVPVPSRFARDPAAKADFVSMQRKVDKSLDDVDWNQEPCERLVEQKDGRIKTIDEGVMVHWMRP